MKRAASFFAAVLLLIAASQATSEEKRFTVPVLDSPSVGPEQAPVTIVEFVDFQ